MVLLLLLAPLAVRSQSWWRGIGGRTGEQRHGGTVAILARLLLARALPTRRAGLRGRLRAEQGAGLHIQASERARGPAGRGARRPQLHCTRACHSAEEQQAAAAAAPAGGCSGGGPCAQEGQATDAAAQRIPVARSRAGAAPVCLCAGDQVAVSHHPSVQRAGTPGGHPGRDDQVRSTREHRALGPGAVRLPRRHARLHGVAALRAPQLPAAETQRPRPALHLGDCGGGRWQQGPDRPVRACCAWGGGDGQREGTRCVATPLSQAPWRVADATLLHPAGWPPST